MNLIEVVNRGGFVVLDTETTGLHTGEIVQIAIADDTGAVLLDTLIKPVHPIPSDATRIHGITNQDVASAPTFAEVVPLIVAALTGKDVIVYNAVYDRKMLHQSAEAAGIPKTDWKVISNWHCAMEAFAVIFGDWNSYRQSYRWQKLSTAAAYYDIHEEGRAHTALADVFTTLAVVKAMAAGKEART